ncbi:MAG: response regulator [Elusimicrobia bacterium]|nr:response regulator [Elusimicrobiota bacterium]MBK7208463.1 response regulator [Elusimicrobiota bacterium]MBK7545223.1 response regulator [Elusimicrobiota bacterium]MBK7574745.1 response regulator [Elusimicrobiota bacterium]MBK7688682.1 response regulator [Elusimicrobiota bacterium]
MSAPTRVLMVEDRPEDRELIEHELKNAKILFESQNVTTREDFLKALRSFKPDIVLSDFSLPEFDALEAIGILRRYESAVPFILVTGAQSEEIAVECMKRGADDYIMKSTLKRLPSAVLNALKNRAAEQQIAQTEGTLREQERQYRTIAEHTRDLIYILDAQGQFTYVSPSFRQSLGYDPAALVGLKAFALIHPDDTVTAREVFRNLPATGNGHAVPFRYKTQDGRWRQYESVVSWAVDEKGDKIQAVVVARDIEDRRQLEDQVRQAQKMDAVGRLAGGVAHDFNNLLTAINGYSDLLLRALEEGDPRRADVEEIKDTAARAAALTQQLLAFSRRQITQPTVMDVNTVVGRVEKMLRRLIGEDIALKTVLAPELHRTRADVGQIEQVIMNLSVNAREAMPQGGTLILETANVSLGPEAEAPAGDYALLTVTDTGCGMDPAVAEHLFEPFFTTKDKRRGTGLGLSTVYGILQQAGAHIRLTTIPGQGTAFRLYFPRVDDAPAPAATALQSDDAFFRGNERVLLAEDDRAVRVMAARVLRQGGYRVTEAANGEEALRLTEDPNFAVDLLITDVVMHGLSGPDLAKILTEKRPGVKVVYISGYMGEDARTSVLKDAGATFLPKPFRPRDLLQKARTILDGGPRPEGA